MREATDNHISTFLYDNANRMIAMENSYNDTTRESEIYTYYPNGNKKSVTDITGKVTQYTYDNAGRLTAETVDGVATSYTYDGYNNRIGKSQSGVQISYIYDSRNRLTKETVTENEQTAVTSYHYDPNGNLYSRQTLTYRENITKEPTVSTVLMGYTADTDDMLLEYNNFNQLTAVTKGNDIVTYDYYANGMRKSKTVDGVITTHIWDGQNIAGEFIDGQFADYLRGNRLIARQTENTTQYYHFNGHGDTLSITNENGILLRNYQYDAFGNVENHHDFDTNPFRYCGEYFDQETGFVYLRARYYSPEIGRFISEDPIRDGLNWYVYCGNNPIMFVDPTGLFGRNTKLSYNQEYNADVVTLQKKLVELKYLDMSDNSGWGYFGAKTEAAVNSYKEDHGLWNEGQYRGIVGITTWEHMGLTVDNDYEFGLTNDAPGIQRTDLFANFNGPKISNGIDLGSAEIGITKLGDDYEFFEWELNTAHADVRAGITYDYVGVDLGARLFSAEGGFKIPIPFTEKSLYIGGEGELVGVGFATSFSDGKLKVKASALVGGSIIIGVE